MPDELEDYVDRDEFNMDFNDNPNPRRAINYYEMRKA